MPVNIVFLRPQNCSRLKSYDSSSITIKGCEKWAPICEIGEEC